VQGVLQHPVPQFFLGGGQLVEAENL